MSFQMCPGGSGTPGAGSPLLLPPQQHLLNFGLSSADKPFSIDPRGNSLETTGLDNVWGAS